jgi:hypothetical protein
MPNRVSYDSLTDAVQGAPTGSTIQVCPGVYAEQVVITKSLTLKGIISGNGGYPVIVPPAGGLVTKAFALTVPNGLSFFGGGSALAAQVFVQSGLEVTIMDIAVDGKNANVPPCNPAVIGILAQDSSLTLTRVAMKNQLQTSPAVCFGAAVLAQNDNGSPTQITIHNSTFYNTSQGYEADGASVTSTLTNNSFAGNPATNANAISIEGGMSTIQGNTINDYDYPPDTTDVNSSAFGIYFYCVPGGSAVNNTITGTQVGILAANGCTTTAVSMTNNNIYGAKLVGIDAGGTNGVVQGNDIRSSLTAIRLPGGAAGNTIQNNLIVDACTAFGSNPAAGVNTILNNTISNVRSGRRRGGPANRMPGPCVPTLESGQGAPRTAWRELAVRKAPSGA